MAYQWTDWKDHVTQYPKRYTISDNGDGTDNIEASPGEIIQQGTPMSATNFNHMEEGIADAHIAAKALLNALRQYGWRIDDLEKATIQETGTKVLTNTSKFPFNSSKSSVALTNPRDNLNYTVVIVGVTGTGNIGEVEVSERLVNGFKLEFSGSAKSATVTYAVIGGYN